MPTRSRKEPAPLTRGRARRTEEPDVLGSSPAADDDGPAKAATKAKAGTGRASGASKPNTADSEPAKTARRQQSIYFDVEVLDRARAAVTHLGAYQPDAGIRSLSDLINPALAAAVYDLEQKFNNGEPFRQVARMRTGRPAGT